MSSQGETHETALSGTIHEILDLSPGGLWKTFLTIYRAGGVLWRHDSRNPDLLADAIAKQDWSTILHPAKYMASMFTVTAIVTWIVDSVINRKFTSFDDFSFFDATNIEMLLWFLVAAAPLHFLLGAGNKATGRVNGFFDGSIKVVQLFMCFFGNFMIFFIPLSVSIEISESISNPFYSMAFVFLIAIPSAVLFLYPLAFFGIPLALGRLYGVSGFRAGFFCYGIIFVFMELQSYITTGKFA